MNILITGSGGLVGSEAAAYYLKKGFKVFGIDNNMRRFFFGADGDVSDNINRLKNGNPAYCHIDMDIRDRSMLEPVFKKHSFSRIIHCASQPSHEKAGLLPIVDFEVNAVGTLNMLEMARQYAPEAVFIHMSTNKVYGASPNEIPLRELEYRMDYLRPDDLDGITESCRIDQSVHSLFGASKLAADIVAQEYGRYYGLKVGIFRAGCITGPNHRGVKLHGFLSYLIKSAVRGQTYQIIGYGGKQVRDIIHSYDVIQAFEAFSRDPRPGEVYNIGGGRENSVSILEAIELIRQIGRIDVKTEYFSQPRIGDHICYITGLKKLKTDFPGWKITWGLEDIIRQMLETEMAGN